MPSIRLLTVLSMLCCSSCALAQKGWVARVDSVLRDRYYGANIDTLYLKRPDKRWSVTLNTNLSFTGLEIDSRLGGESRTEMETDVKFTTSVKVS